MVTIVAIGNCLLLFRWLYDPGLKVVRKIVHESGSRNSDVNKASGRLCLRALRSVM